MELLGHYAIATVLDVGANEGEFGLFLRRLNYLGSIVSLEPASKSFRILEKTTVDDDKWLVLQAAAADLAGQGRLHIAQSNVFSSLLMPRTDKMAQFGELSDQVGEELVELLPLADLPGRVPIEMDPSQTFLKLDVQGYENEVLRGLNLAALPQLLQLELGVVALYDGMPSFSQLLDTVFNMGYVPTGFFPVNRDEELRLVELDGVFVLK